MKLITITAQKAAVQVSMTRCGTICDTRLNSKTFMTTVKRPSVTQMSGREINFDDRLDDEIDESKHCSGQDQPFPIAIEVNPVNQARRRPNSDGVGKNVDDEA